MITNPSCGWCLFQLDSFTGHPSYLTDVPVELPLGDKKYSVYVGRKHIITDAQMKKLIELELDTANGVSEMLCKE